MAAPDLESSLSGNAPETLTGNELLEMDLARLGEIFSGAQSPDAEEMTGRFRCLWLGGPEDDYIPKSLKKMRALLAASPLFPWKGMDFERAFDEETTGANLLFGMDKGVRLFHFKVQAGVSEFDGESCLVFDYDVEKNFLFFNKLRDEVRRVNLNLYLGRGNVVIGGEARFIAYFTLEPE